MTHRFARIFRPVLIIAATLTAIELTALSANAQKPVVYQPLTLPASNEANDTLTEKDIPLGDGGFARDYRVKLKAGDQVAIDLTSDNFDTIVTLLGADGSTIGQNDDGPDGSNNSLLFARIKGTGEYIIRVRSFGETGGGAFKLKITPLQPVK
ncbi:peptidase domain protein [Crinalium epipsammum PCC 9333]|uniref:Peptidase domain protein n=1 Tax=Crinalium epipsammum PCC 9333 TaxID=1173022 RepID=K9VZE4_9CYAN|nr:PPC domain-containing protein [Crinalium epipsammum]AFZ12914.1 peptidase domain protein [Crinalium epipsammum PCC 9333]